MGKRVDPRRLRAAQTYTVPELARSIGVSTGTVRGWIRHGLPALNTQRPTLIVGSDAKDFLSQRKRSKKRPLRPNEVYCLTCKEPRSVFENMVELERVLGKPARITGFCATCEGSVSRVVGAAQIGELDRFFEVTGNKDHAA